MTYHDVLVQKLRESCIESLEWYVSQCAREKATAESEQHLTKIRETIKELKSKGVK